MSTETWKVSISAKDPTQNTNVLPQTIAADGQFAVSNSADGESGFDRSRFFARLNTVQLGQILLHSAEMPSTQDLLKKHAATLPDGTICTAIKQTSGRGRRDNRWESPNGCLMFSVLTRLKIDATKSPFLNYVISLAIIRAIKTISSELLQGTEVDVKIKWPNDIYYDNQKIGGILLHSSFRGTEFQLVTGIGLNVLNTEPTICLKQIFDAVRPSSATEEIHLSPEDMLAEIANNLEPLLQIFVSDGFDRMRQEYLSYWIHSGQKLKLESNEVTLSGITENGYLLGHLSNGESVELMPDGNTIDMLSGMIIRRLH